MIEWLSNLGLDPAEDPAVRAALCAALRAALAPTYGFAAPAGCKAGRCRLTVSKPVLKALMVSALEPTT